MAIAILGTCDTKLNELLFLKEQLHLSGVADVYLIDFGRTKITHPEITHSSDEVAGFLENGASQPDLSTLSRADVLSRMTDRATALVEQLYSTNKIIGLISAGGTGGTSVASAVMRNAVPIGFPKLLVSTVASGDTGPIVGEADITMMYSVVDIAGMNSVLRNVLSNAAGAMSGMSSAYTRHITTQRTEEAAAQGVKKPIRIGVTMFGVTTPCVTACQSLLESSKILLSRHSSVEVFVFHATGHGGLAMERLVREGKIDAVLDVTTTEIADYLFGGDMSAGPNRLTAALDRGIPCIISTGACDMVNFGATETVPEKYQSRHLMKHNATVTLMRTSVEENRTIGEHIAKQIVEHAKDPRAVLVAMPTAGISMVSEHGGDFEDHEADMNLFDAIENGLTEKPVYIMRLPMPINDELFAQALVEELENIVIRQNST